MRKTYPEFKRDRSPSEDETNSRKRVRVSLTRNSCLYFKSNSSFDCPAPFEARKQPVRSVYKTPPTPLPDPGTHKTPFCYNLLENSALSLPVAEAGFIHVGLNNETLFWLR